MSSWMIQPFSNIVGKIFRHCICILMTSRHLSTGSVHCKFSEIKFLYKTVHRIPVRYLLCNSWHRIPAHTNLWLVYPIVSLVSVLDDCASYVLPGWLTITQLRGPLFSEASITVYVMPTSVKLLPQVGPPSSRTRRLTVKHAVKYKTPQSF